jgi:putative ABC transport system ATP-binding protein
VSLTVERGEFVAIMGTSGSGKSTLMNILGCLDRPTAAATSWSAATSPASTATHWPRSATRLGFVFQSFNLLSRTSALENVELPLLYAGVRGRERRGRPAPSSASASARASTTPQPAVGRPAAARGDRPGDRHRAALILADEPTGNLDSRTSLEIMALFQELSAQRHHDRARHPRARHRAFTDARRR